MKNKHYKTYSLPGPDGTGFFSRRSFLGAVGLGAVTIGLQQLGCNPKGDPQDHPKIQGFERSDEDDPSASWEPFSERKVRVGLVGYGVSKFSADFGFQNHPNVEVVAVSDLFPDRCAALAAKVSCKKTYPSLEELVKFITSIIQDRKPLVDIVAALNMTIPGIVAHKSAMRGGEWLKVPQYS